jgi:hypothetical protein
MDRCSITCLLLTVVFLPRQTYMSTMATCLDFLVKWRPMRSEQDSYADPRLNSPLLLTSPPISFDHLNPSLWIPEYYCSALVPKGGYTAYSYFYILPKGLCSKILWHTNPRELRPASMIMIIAPKTTYWSLSSIATRGLHHAKPYASPNRS